MSQSTFSREDFQKWGAIGGGMARGKAKRRGDADYYAALAKKRIVKAKRKAITKQEADYPRQRKGVVLE